MFSSNCKWHKVQCNRKAPLKDKASLIIFTASLCNGPAELYREEIRSFPPIRQGLKMPELINLYLLRALGPLSFTTHSEC